VTHNYVVVEATTLARNRLGAGAVRLLHDDLLAPVRVAWVDEHVHAAGLAALLAAPRSGPSLVDWVSFEVMRRLGVETAFAFDRDFRRHGFATIP
jgi:predicted nucleic acid-binding protein